MRTLPTRIDVIGVIGVGMTGRARLGGCRAAPAVHDAGLPEMCLVDAGDAQKARADDTTSRYGSLHAESVRGTGLWNMFRRPLHDLGPTPS